MKYSKLNFLLHAVGLTLTVTVFVKFNCQCPILQTCLAFLCFPDSRVAVYEFHVYHLFNSIQSFI